MVFNTIRTIEANIDFPSYSTSVLTSSNISIVNNIFNSNLSYNLLIDDPASLQTSNYNCFNGTHPFHHKINDSQRNELSLSDWKTLSGQYHNSLISEPNFISETDSRHNTSGLIGKGTSYGNVTTDIDGNNREVPPCIGASCVQQATSTLDVKKQKSLLFAVKEKQLIPVEKNIQSFSVYDLTGRQVYKYNTIVTEPIGLYHLNNGIYILQVKVQNQIVTQKIMIQ